MRIALATEGTRGDVHPTPPTVLEPETRRSVFMTGFWDLGTRLKPMDARRVPGALRDAGVAQGEDTSDGRSRLLPPHDGQPPHPHRINVYSYPRS